MTQPRRLLFLFSSLNHHNLISTLQSSYSFLKSIHTALLSDSLISLRIKARPLLWPLGHLSSISLTLSLLLNLLCIHLPDHLAHFTGMFLPKGLFLMLEFSHPDVYLALGLHQDFVSLAIHEWGLPWLLSIVLPGISSPLSCLFSLHWRTILYNVHVICKINLLFIFYC